MWLSRIARVTILALAFAAPALAAPAPDDDSPEMQAAQGHWKAGRAYFEQGDLQRALREFRETARNVDRPQLDFNIARTYDRLGDAARALDYYEKYLRRLPAAEDRKEVEARIAYLGPRTGTLVVTTTLPGTLLLVDEEPMEIAALSSGVRITAGRHRLVASKDGYLARTQEAQVRPGETTTLALDPLTAGGSVIVERSRWWIGLIIGAVVLVAGAAAITAGVLLSSPIIEMPYVGNARPMGFIEISP